MHLIWIQLKDLIQDCNKFILNIPSHMSVTNMCVISYGMKMKSLDHLFFHVVTHP